MTADPHNSVADVSTGTKAIQHIESKPTRVLAAILLMAFAVRTAVVVAKFEVLSVDRDAYWSMAENLVTFGEFRDPNVSWPTFAYRPPLYPLVIAAFNLLRIDAYGLAVFQILAGTATVWLTFLAGCKLGLGRQAHLASLFVACDPLLAYYTVIPMTETLFTLLTTGLLLFFVSSNPLQWERQVGVGVLFGLCALCRPSIWAFGVLMAVSWLFSFLLSMFRQREQGLVDRPGRSTIPWPLLLSVAVTVSPWVIRNSLVLGKPVVMTTHGGYTLLLGNNPTFYEQVVVQQWGAVWSEVTLVTWQQSLERRMNHEEPPVRTELERDRWMRNEAFAAIGEQPALFMQACVLRLRRFWNVTPLAEDGPKFPRWLRWAVTTYFSLVFTLAILGSFYLEASDWSRWRPIVFLIVAFTAVHLIYWSNARMRAPVIPAVALLAAHGWKPSRTD